LGLSVFAPYALGQAPLWYGMGYLAILAAAVIRWKFMLGILQDPEVAHAGLAWGLLVAGCLLLLACVSSYSGGAWVGDWEEHYQRPLLFLRLRPEDEEFARRFTLTARPPLANTADAALMWITGAEFARHQTFMLLLNTLVFFPAALFCRTFGGNRAAPAMVAFFLLLNPMFVQNATYAWTKSIAGFFILIALHILFSAPYCPRRTLYGFAMFGLGVVTHYSACVWVIAFGLPWLLIQYQRWKKPASWPVLFGAGVGFLAMIIPWLTYAIWRYGLAATFGTNSTVVDGAQFAWPERLMNMGNNLWTTTVPHVLRSFDRSLVAQSNPWTAFRDQVFYIYQTNLFFALGTPALILLVWVVLRGQSRRSPWRTVWFISVPLVVILGTAVHGTPDQWGLTHICLLPLVMIGIALGAAQIPSILGERTRPWLFAGLLAGWGIDFALGIAIHYRAAAYELNRVADQPLLAYLESVSPFARRNFWQKISLGQDYFADGFSLGSAQYLLGVVVVSLLLGLLSYRLSTSASNVSRTSENFQEL
jgi:hypothetical protein